MSNVLTAGGEKELRRLYRSNFVLVGGLVLLGGAVLALVALIPSFLLTRGATLAPSSVLTTEALSERGSERIEILRAQVLSEQFAFVAASTTSPLDALNAALRVRPSGASIQEIQYTRAEKGTIILEGKASNRTSVSAYRDALLQLPHFSDVSVPASALAGAEGGRFSITLTGAF